MGWSSDQVSPPPEALDQVLRPLVVPALCEITPSQGRKLTAAAEVWRADALLLTQPLELPAQATVPADPPALGMTCRVRFRKTSVAGTLLMHVECLADEVDRRTGFSCFELKGMAKDGGEGWAATRESLVIRYHDLRWAGP